MREIEFRGYSKRFGRWLIGFLIGDNKIREFGIPDKGHEVLHISQYTGLKDKNGRKIFEGDIVEFETNVNCTKEKIKPYWKDCYEKQYAIGSGTWWVRKDQAVVQWNSKDGMWDLKVYNNGKYKRKSKLCTYRESGYVVIGNIYDNPELLEGKDE